MSQLKFPFQVKRWITLNEPWVTAVEGHGIGDHAPGIKSPGILEYVAAHNQIRGHAKVYRLYQREFAESQKGKSCPQLSHRGDNGPSIHPCMHAIFSWTSVHAKLGRSVEARK